jgi:hypothetical protein
VRERKREREREREREIKCPEVNRESRIDMSDLLFLISIKFLVTMF